MKKNKVSTTQIIALGFVLLIILGALLLMLPIASRSGEPTSWIDALFTAGTSSCVTGLVVVNTLEHWSWFGQLVIMFLIQIGGLGVVTIISLFVIIFGGRLSVHQRLLLQDAFNINSMYGIRELTKKVVGFSVVIEFIGALFYMIRFIPLYGVFKGIWHSIFTAVSAFCNAGIDLTGGDSLCAFRDDPLINIVTILLIIIAGLGYPVWWDIAHAFKRIFKEKYSISYAIKRMMLHSKIVLSFTCILIVFGALFIFCTDFGYESSLGNLPLGEKIMSAFFQSVTLRTAGFQTIPQADFSNAAQVLAMIFMFIGGSPCGTAGGVKTVTFAIILFNIYANIKDNKDTEAFNRKISSEIVRKAFTVIMVSFFVLIISIMSQSLAMPEANLLDIAYEMTSAVATVGLSKGLTGTLTLCGKMIVILTMLAGRIGPISMALSFNISTQNKRMGRQLPEENIMVG